MAYEWSLQLKDSSTKCTIQRKSDNPVVDKYAAQYKAKSRIIEESPSLTASQLASTMQCAHNCISNLVPHTEPLTCRPRQLGHYGLSATADKPSGTNLVEAMSLVGSTIIPSSSRRDTVKRAPLVSRSAAPVFHDRNDRAVVRNDSPLLLVEYSSDDKLPGLWPQRIDSVHSYLCRVQRKTKAVYTKPEKHYDNTLFRRAIKKSLERASYASKGHMHRPTNHIKNTIDTPSNNSVRGNIDLFVPSNPPDFSIRSGGLSMCLEQSLDNTSQRNFAITEMSHIVENQPIENIEAETYLQSPRIDQEFLNFGETSSLRNAVRGVLNVTNHTLANIRDFGSEFLGDSCAVEKANVPVPSYKQESYPEHKPRHMALLLARQPSSLPNGCVRQHSDKFADSSQFMWYKEDSQSRDVTSGVESWYDEDFDIPCAPMQHSLMSPESCQGSTHESIRRSCMGPGAIARRHLYSQRSKSAGARLSDSEMETLIFSFLDHHSSGENLMSLSNVDMHVASYTASPDFSPVASAAHSVSPATIQFLPSVLSCNPEVLNCSAVQYVSTQPVVHATVARSEHGADLLNVQSRSAVLQHSMNTEARRVYSVPMAPSSPLSEHCCEGPSEHESVADLMLRARVKRRHSDGNIHRLDIEFPAHKTGVHSRNTIEQQPASLLPATAASGYFFTSKPPETAGRTRFKCYTSSSAYAWSGMDYRHDIAFDIVNRTTKTRIPVIRIGSAK